MTELAESDWVLVADIGGTHARFAYLKPDDPSPQPIGTYTAETCPQFEKVMEQLCTSIEELDLPLGRLARICLAVAANPSADEIALTNNAWCFRRSELAKMLGCDNMLVVNDFAAVARSLPLLKPEDTVQIGGGEAQAGGVMVAIGPGTGTGVASLIFDGGTEPLVVPGEGGHVDFAPVGDTEIAVLQRLRGQFDRVSIERLLSGDGILNLYRTLCDINGCGMTLRTPEAVGEAAQADTDPMAAETMALFFAVLGSVAGDLALTLGARGGVYIAGGIVPRYVDLMRRSQFRSRFESKGRFAEHNKVIPSFVVTHPNPGLLGVACFSNNT